MLRKVLRRGVWPVMSRNPLPISRLHLPRAGWVRRTTASIFQSAANKKAAPPDGMPETYFPPQTCFCESSLANGDDYMRASRAGILPAGLRDVVIASISLSFL